MLKKDIEVTFNASINKNFDSFVGYIDYQTILFYDLKPVISQLINCQILEMHIATIVLTNHLLERALKLSLIYKFAGVGEIATDKVSSIFEEAHKKYGEFTLGKSIELCKKEGLINKVEKDQLFDLIRTQIRNGFSHGDSSAILVNVPDKLTAYEGDLTTGKTAKIQLNMKVIPGMQGLLIDKFAEMNATKYFHFVYNLMKNIEKRMFEL